MEINGYDIKTPRPIEVVVDANATSATISWEYVCKYKENGCKTCEISAIESIQVEITPNTSCTENVITSSYTWNDNIINYTITQKPNNIIYDEPIVEYEITNVDGAPTSLSCGDIIEREVEVTYRSSAYTESCKAPTISTGSTTSIIKFDCSNQTTNGNDVSKVVNILGKDCEYTYHCDKCEGQICTPSSRIENFVVSKMYINGVEKAEIPCNGASNITCDGECTIIDTDSHCKETRRTIEVRNARVSDVGRCTRDYNCCKRHLVQAKATINGVKVDINLVMARDSNGSCDENCGETCLVISSAIITPGTDVTIRYDSNHGGRKYNGTDVIPLDYDGDLIVSYFLDVTKQLENCENEVYTFMRNSAKCRIYKMLCLSNNRGSIKVDVTLEVKHYNRGGVEYDLESPYPIITFSYYRETCN